MVVVDGIIFSLQKFGGISMYFKNVIKNIRHIDDKKLKVIGYNNESQSDLIDEILDRRVLEQYRDIDFKINNQSAILHSSYYRISKEKNFINVVSVYDFLYEKFESNLFKKSVHKFQKNHAISNAHSVICISESTKADFLEFYPKFNEQNVYVTHLSHSKEFKVSSEFKLSDKFNRPYVIFVGMRSKHKNFDICVKALAGLNDVNLIIIGGGQFSKEEYVLLNRNLKNRFEHKLNISSEELSIYYQNAICLLYPSIYEGFGIPILEAMASGCPVISTNSSSIPEVSNNSAILLDDPCQGSVKEAIKFLLTEQNNLKYIQLGLDNVKRFSWEKTALKTLDIYNNLL
ncbi:glycosyltransferase family 4 protein [Aquirufa sp.]|jgi:mannosyltransferase|uniref:glycosyltransferase family 4 protein n=1 Tax=Aquirufa sp. TaxID=2676249 RepID=UPI00378507DE